MDVPVPEAHKHRWNDARLKEDIVRHAQELKALEREQLWTTSAVHVIAALVP